MHCDSPELHCDSPELPSPDEYVDDLQDELYVHGLQMAAALGAQLQAELAKAPGEDSIKKWYMWTRGLNQLQTFRFAPTRQAAKEQKQRGRPPQEPKIHLNGPAPQLRKPATPKPSPAPEVTPEQSNFTKPAPLPLTPAEPTKFDLINRSEEKAPSSPLTALTPTEFDRLYANLRQGPKTYVEGPCLSR